MKKFLFIMLAFVGIVSLGSCGFVDDGVRTAHNEFDPSAMLKKYEWFKNQTQFIQKSQKDIANAKTLRDGIKAQFEEDNGKNHTSWDPVTKNQYQSKVDLQDQMVMAITATCNGIIADYNAQSSKFNWAYFKDKSDLPPTSFETIK